MTFTNRTNRALLWQRLDTVGTELALVQDGPMRAIQGSSIAARPLPYSCNYLIRLDDDGALKEAEFTTAGAGWYRHLRLERTNGQWRVTDQEQGDLDRVLRDAGLAGAGLSGIEEPDRLHAAADVHLARSPASVMPAIRRMLVAGRTEQDSAAAWIAVPSLRVLPASYRYSMVEGGHVSIQGDTIDATVAIDSDGYVVAWPGLAQRIANGNA